MLACCPQDYWHWHLIFIMLWCFLCLFNFFLNQTFILHSLFIINSWTIKKTWEVSVNHYIIHYVAKSMWTPECTHMYLLNSIFKTLSMGLVLHSPYQFNFSGKDFYNVMEDEGIGSHSDTRSNIAASSNDGSKPRCYCHASGIRKTVHSRQYAYNPGF